MECIGKHNFRVKEALSLKRSRCRKSSWFLVEGTREIQKALHAGYICQHVFCGTHLVEKEKEFLNKLKKDSIEVLYCLDSTLAQLSFKEHYDNFIAVMQKKIWSREDFLTQRRNIQPFYLIIEQIEKPGNLGAILRIADGAGVDGVILCDPVVDLYNPNVVRSSLGAVFSLPILSLFITEVQELLKQEGWQVFVTSPQAEQLYFSKNYRGATALVFGSEKDGLTKNWFCEDFLKIALPMCGESDSLNLSASVAAVAYEVVRQRWLN
ncbi:23S rRNA (guanosine-2'-O-)-methyltransferase RlmB,23S rRNA (guanosine-2'-O-)-methyltransferase,RNA methyltransferase, TrmH family, group 3,SpoU rRNA Methylase family [Chlamydia serpentis]|uniref:23S rRNA (Guanosine-2'-O-)-methyltransferase RlmB,23S rRNA (Guanosine-2'-O-)-methyltransferase,RNA methyltransferase, TrmH family, group 3,SpoU rRNA Methylase family n=1 Tax=Chlamydia serpentis TaxID=1967782 RepID=A0A2R8FB52_9CHLA|nr:RNA methyltransferase [Chlamydia serpentis]SPN73649.1 23S rRNA (guanosine-2'-O-)-methyltransferase RlmB,23S rRNA (guanosine-2'-O-)-methyltransferase,RNA methyltransferase, TrmH family, group 3,SpoU rRNA Methylase family [Chlamydia serpentis]